MEEELEEQKTFISNPSFKQYQDLWYFGIEYIPQEVLNIIRDKSITQNIFRTQENNSSMCGFYCIAFIEYMLAGRTSLVYTDSFSPNNYKNNEKIIYKLC